MSEYFFRTDALSVGYHGVPLIRDIVLSLKRGEILTLIGPNGAGKTTILKSLTRHLAAICGDVRIAGDSLFKMSADAAARIISVVLTERVHGEYLSAWDVAASGRYPYTGRFGTLSGEDHRIVSAALAEVDASALAFHRFETLSDGQRQRVLLARALAQEPELIVLDEPTSYLDLRYQTELLALLQRLAHEKQITVILSLHELDLARKLSDKVACVSGDRIRHIGTPDQIFRPEIICPLYELPPNAWSPFNGSVELPQPDGTPETFVIAGCGTGTDTFRALQRAGRPFYAGILFTNDLDFPAAQSLASRVFAAEPFRPIDAAVTAEALAALRSCQSVLYTGVPIAEGNQALKALLDEARRCGTLQDNVM